MVGLLYGHSRSTLSRMQAGMQAGVGRRQNRIFSLRLLCHLQHDPELRPSISEVLESPQLQSRLNLLPAGLETSLSQHNLSLSFIEVRRTCRAH